MSLALVYLARGASGGLPSVKAFFEAYCAYPPGCPHSLIVIIKGWKGVKGEEEAKKIAEAHEAKVIGLPDDGFDWGGYMRVAPLLSHDWVFFINTHSRPRIKGWLDLLKKTTEEPGMNVGAVGATASYESFIPGFLTPIQNALKLIGFTWNKFPSFPNPHLRSNAFLVRRQLFIDFTATQKIPSCKRDAWLLESGRDGFTAFLMDRGLKPLVTGANGKYYTLDQWINSGTFRVPGQPNLLIEDNQTRAYDTVNKNYKKRLEMRAWGKTF